MPRPITFTELTPIEDSYDGTLSLAITGTGAITPTVSPAPIASTGFLKLKDPDDATKNEIMKWTANAAGVLTITAGNRGLGGTTAQTHVADKQVLLVYTEELHSEIDVALAAKIEADSSDTLTNKTIDANGTGNNISNLETDDFAANVVDTDDTLAANSDTRIPTQQAVKDFVNNTITGFTGSADETSAGTVELATGTEVDAGTDATRAISPDRLAGSYAGTKTVQVEVFGPNNSVFTGDGKKYFHIPANMTGMDLVSVHAQVVTAGTTGTTDIQIHNVTDTADMLSTVITIDSTETGSDTAATPAVIDTANDDVATNDLLRIDVDAVSTTAPKGLIITLEFRLP